MEQQVKEITDLIDRIEKCKINIKNEGGPNEFRDFVGPKKPGKPGIGKSTLQNWIEKLQELRLLAKREKKLSGKNEDKLNKHIRNIKFLEAKVADFLHSKEKAAEVTLVKRLYLYFFYLEHEPSEPKLGRAVVELFSNETAELLNVPDGIRKNYNGKYHLSESRVLTLELNAAVQNRQLHLKAYCSDLNEDGIFLGAYLTYENNHIEQGTVAMTPILTTPSFEPQILSFTQNREAFEDVPDTIRAYLSVKKYSYQTIPNYIHSQDLLDRYIKENAKEKPELRFIETLRPKVYLSFPNSSIKDEVFLTNEARMKALKQKLDETFSNKCDIEYVNKKYDSLRQRITPPPSFEILKKARFFVLVYTATDKGSLCLVQLGWAMANCKKVMLFHEEGAISGNIERLDRMGVIINPFVNNDEGYETVYKKLELAIAEDLRDFFFQAGSTSTTE